MWSSFTCNFIELVNNAFPNRMVNLDQRSLYLTRQNLIASVRKKDKSQESDFKDAVDVCLPLINAAIGDIEKGTFPKNCLLNIEIPTAPSANQVC